MRWKSPEIVAGLLPRRDELLVLASWHLKDVDQGNAHDCAVLRCESLSEVVALAAAFAIAVLATPAGISGAVLLLPFQVSVLGTPSPAVTPTNLLYNVVATPGALYRYWRQGQTGGRLCLVLIAGTLPGVSPGRSSGSCCCPARTSSTSSSPRSCCRWGCGWPSPGQPAQARRAGGRGRRRPRPRGGGGAPPPAGGGAPRPPGPDLRDLSRGRHHVHDL